MGGIIGISMQQYVLLLRFSTAAQVASAVNHCMNEDNTTGLCKCCETGYSGNTCSDCPACVQNYSNNTCRRQCEGHTMHGEYCNKTCPSTCSGCRRENGYCMQCKDGKYGKLCLKSCDCLDGPCKRKTGTCIQWEYCQHCETKRCYKDGEDGTRVCHGKCEGPYYGIDCGKHCPPSCKSCDQGNGSCPTDGSTSGNVPHPYLYYLLPRIPTYEDVSILNAVVLVVAILAVFIMLIKPRRIQHGLAWMWRKCRCFKPDDNDSPNKDTAFNLYEEFKYIKRSVSPSQEGEGESFLEADLQSSDSRSISEVIEISCSRNFQNSIDESKR